MKSVMLLFCLVFSSVLQSAEIKEYDFYNGLSSKKQEQRVAAVKLFEKLPGDEKIRVLREVYIDNDRLFDQYYYEYSLIESIKEISSVKSAALEEKLYAEIHKILDSEEADPELMHRKARLNNRIKHYIKALPYVAQNGDRSFDAIFRYIKLHHNSSWDVNEGLVALIQLPYKRESDHILQLLEILSYHNKYENFSGAVQYVEKIFRRYVNEKNSTIFVKRLSHHIGELRSVTFEDNKGGRQAYLKERIRKFESLVSEYSNKYQYNLPAKQASYQISNIQSVVSSVSPNKTVPVFHGGLPADGPKRQAYNKKLMAGIFSAPQKVADIEYKVGLVNRQIGGTAQTSTDRALYLLVSNMSDKDSIVSASFQQINAAGFIIDESNLSHNGIIGNARNIVIGTRLSKLSPLAQNYNITVTVRVIDYAEPEIPLYKRVQANSVNLSKTDSAFKREYIKQSSNKYHAVYKALINQNQRKLKFNKLTKKICKDNYKVSIHRFWSDNTEDQYLLYNASCTRWSGECTDGHARQVLYKLSTTKGKKIEQLLELVSKRNNFDMVESVNDINNDGNIELGMNNNYCLSSSRSIQKLKSGKLIMLNEGANYSEGGYVDDPHYRTNPFVYSEI